MIPRIIAYSGTHGTGKTTAAYQRGVHEKIAHPHQSVHVLCNQETVCPYPINKSATPDTQVWIFTNQISREIALLSQFDIVVTDRTAMDIVAYTHVLGFHSLAHSMMSLASIHASVYREIVVRRMAFNEFCHPDGIRETGDRLFRSGVETCLLDIYADLDNGGVLGSGVVRYE